MKKEQGAYDTPSKDYTKSVPGQHSLYSDEQPALAIDTKWVMPAGRGVFVIV